MRAAYYEKAGPAREVFKVGEVPTPEPGPGEVRVKMAVSGVNPSDWKMRTGRAMRNEVYPITIPHSDGAGTIDKVGAGVPAKRIGERVWTWNARWQRAFGTCAEYCVLPDAQAVALPDRTDFDAGACLGIPALTAWQGVVTDGGVRGQDVLVTGGAGAVGRYAIQFARLKGAKRVIATVSGDAKAAQARSAGADLVVNYKTENVAARIAEITGGKGVERIVEVDVAGNAKLYPAILADYGLVAAYGSNTPDATFGFGPNISKNIGYRFYGVYMQPPALRAQGLSELTWYLKAGSITHVIGKRFPLADIFAAHEAVEQGAVIGNVVVDIR